MPDSHDRHVPGKGGTEATRRALIAMLEKGLEDIRQGRVVTAEEMERRVEALLTERAARKTP